MKKLLEERITKIIASCGITSRRGAEKLIQEGEVVLNGKVVTDLGAKAICGKDSIKINDRLILKKEPKAYYIFNKPIKCVSTMFDVNERTSLINFIGKIKFRILPVGNLGYNTAGALILTNDGELIKALISKNSSITKTYKLKVSGKPSFEDIKKVAIKIKSADSFPKLTKVFLNKKTKINSWIELTVTSVPPKQIEQIFKNKGMHIQKWVRSRYGQISLKDLGPGEIRPLSQNEIKYLNTFVSNI